jgi:hypothetical protein
MSTGREVLYLRDAFIGDSDISDNADDDLETTDEGSGSDDDNKSHDVDDPSEIENNSSDSEVAKSSS